jgi:hypothetical protein
VTEAEWQRSARPQALIRYIRDRTSDRKLRLLACACCRLCWDELPDERCRRVVERAESFADAGASHLDLVDAARAAHTVIKELLERHPFYPRPLTPADVALYRADAAWRAADLSPLPVSVPLTAERAAAHFDPARQADLEAAQVRAVRDLFGNPFETVAVDRPWLTWNDGTVPRLARASYDQRAFDRLPILADALEDAGCADVRLLAHCRDGEAHYPGCWVLDLLLGKE